MLNFLSLLSAFFFQPGFKLMIFISKPFIKRNITSGWSQIVFLNLFFNFLLISFFIVNFIIFFFSESRFLITNSLKMLHEFNVFGVHEQTLLNFKKTSFSVFFFFTFDVVELLIVVIISFYHFFFFLLFKFAVVLFKIAILLVLFVLNCFFLNLTFILDFLTLLLKLFNIIFFFLF